MLQIDFFELMFLAESVIPPQPIARTMCFERFSEEAYHKMSDQQREQLFKHVIQRHNFNLDNEYCMHFFDRFSPANQYLVYAFKDNCETAIPCYYHNKNYHTNKDRFVDKIYITKVVRLWDNKQINF